MISRQYPTISVLMSTYNREEYISSAIESILNQTYGDFEFIIIDDCSADNTAKIIQQYSERDSRISFFRNEKNKGLIANLNFGISQARGIYIARMDDDDISFPERFEKQLNFLESNQDITVLGTYVETIGEKYKNTWVTTPDPDILNISLNFFNPICHPTVMMRKSFLEEHGLKYDVLYAEDYSLWKDILINGGKFANLPEVLLKYRIHDKSISHGKSVKIQTRSAKKIRGELINRYFNNKMRAKHMNLIMYPFESNKKKRIHEVLARMKKFPQYASPNAIEKFEMFYCGKPCTMHIFFASDDKFVRHLCVAIASILVNSLPYENFNFYILDGGIKNSSKKKVESLKRIKEFNIEYIDMNSFGFDKLPLTKDCSHITKETYYRYIIPILKPDLERCFYFDSDIIVEDSLNKLWHMDFEDNYVIAAEEANSLSVKDAERLEVDCIFNAGILLINNKKWVDENISESLFENTLKLEKSRNLIWQDQDVLNHTFNNKVKFVSPKYNLQFDAFFNDNLKTCSQLELRDARNSPVIIHFNTSSKPWNKGCKHPLKNLYFKYLRLTSYRGYYWLSLILRLFSKVGRVFYSRKENGYTTKTRILFIKFRKTNHCKQMLSELLSEFSRLDEKFNSRLDEKFNALSETLSIELNHSIYSKHLEVFPKYRNINEGKNVVLVATGPSAKAFEPIDNAVYVGVNRAFEIDSVNFDYLFLQDYSGATKTYINNFMAYNADVTRKFVGYIVPIEISPQCVIPEKYSYYPNVERYYVCHPTRKSGFTFDISCQPFGDSYSVVFPAMQFILWTNPKRIYLVGCDCNTKGNLDCLEKNFLEVGAVLSGWKRMKKFAEIYYPDTRIISVNPVGLRGLFEDVFQ